MLVKTYRGAVFIHDRFIIAISLFGNLYKELPSIIAPHLSRVNVSSLPAVSTLSAITGVKPRIQSSFYGTLDRIHGDVDRVFEAIEPFKPRSIYEYVLRGMDEEVFDNLVKKGFIWLVPYSMITGIGLSRDGRVLNIRYKCPVSGEARVLRLVYDESVMETIRYLCRFNGNTVCG